MEGFADWTREAVFGLLWTGVDLLQRSQWLAGWTAADEPAAAGAEAA